MKALRHLLASISTLQLALAVTPATEGNGLPQWLAKLPDSKSVTGNVTVSQGPGGNGVSVQAYFLGLPTEGGPFLYHIHEKPIGPDWNCSAAGPHLSPYTSDYPCTNTTHPETCEAGDLSGKHGNFTGPNFTARLATGTSGSSSAALPAAAPPANINTITITASEPYVQTITVSGDGGSGPAPKASSSSSTASANANVNTVTVTVVGQPVHTVTTHDSKTPLVAPAASTHRTSASTSYINNTVTVTAVAQTTQTVTASDTFAPLPVFSTLAGNASAGTATTTVTV
ncbi:uncharacterized protein RHO25_000211 [Cercospora beticola]|uniref:Superoxide dismutase copper/zinc binding domain-containing protein n=1 Tax=Cercospora beticola TaxID=122368 RepID=A0ABZ0N7W7_CERBT|nr:hypothetical protein RHO25_000211 [Cercospora beticola]